MSDVGWRRCNTCKGDIDFRDTYYVCSVSTCNRKGTDFTFCSVECWEVHVPVFRHRDSGAIERTAPSQQSWHAQQAADEETERTRTERAAERTQPTPITPTGPVPRDILVVASKLKAYIRARSGMNTSDGVMDALSDRLRELCDGAIEQASQAGRKTVLDRDF